MESFSPYAVQPFSPLTTNFVRVLSKSEMTYEIFNHCISNILHSVNFVKDMVVIKFQNKKFKLMNGSKQLIGRPWKDSYSYMFIKYLQFFWSTFIEFPEFISYSDWISDVNTWFINTFHLQVQFQIFMNQGDIPMSIFPLVRHHAPPTYKSIIAQLLMLISALR